MFLALFVILLIIWLGAWLAFHVAGDNAWMPNPAARLSAKGMPSIMRHRRIAKK